MMSLKSFIFSLFLSAFAVSSLSAQHDTPTNPPANAPEQPSQTPTIEGTQHATTTHGVEKKYDATPDIMSHIANTHEFHFFGHYSIPLPCIVYEKEGGNVKTFMSSVFEHGEKSYEGGSADGP